MQKEKKESAKRSRKAVIGEVISSDYDISENFDKFFCRYSSKFEKNPKWSSETVIENEIENTIKKCNKQIQKWV